MIDNKRCASRLAALTVTAVLLAAPQPPREIPQHLAAAAPEFKVAPGSMITVGVTSRRASNAENPQVLANLQRRVMKALSEMHFTLVPDKASARLSLEFIDEPNIRYGMFHYQNAPYVYLTIREPPGGHLVYCSYERLGHIYSATGRLLSDFKRYIEHTAPMPSGSLQPCAEQAMRPL